MEKYRRTSGIDSGNAEMQANATQFAPALDGWRDFVADFEDELDDGKATFSRRGVPVQQTIEEEYSTYVMGAPSSGTTLDTLKFWQVSILHETLACQNRYLHSPIFSESRLMRKPSQLYSGLQWTTSQSRHPPFPVNVFSRRVQRRTRKSAIVSSRSSWKRCKFSNLL